MTHCIYRAYFLLCNAFAFHSQAAIAGIAAVRLVAALPTFVPLVPNSLGECLQPRTVRTSEPGRSSEAHDCLHVYHAYHHTR